MPARPPFIPAQRPPLVWERDKLFREARYEDDVPWMADDEDGDDADR